MSCELNALVTDRAVEMNITAKRNDTFSPYVTLLENGVPYDFTSFDIATMQIKTTAETSDIVLTISIANGMLTLGGSAGTITWSVDDTDMDIEPDVYIYDLEVYNSTSGVRETVLKGNFTIKEDVTRL